MAKTNYVAYPAVLDDRENSPEVYTVTFPDVPGAITFGHGLTEALVMGAEALGLVLYDEEQLPEPSTLAKVSEENPGTIVTYIFVDLVATARRVRTPVVRKNTTIPVDLAMKAEEAGINFSAALTEALKEKLNE